MLENLTVAYQDFLAFAKANPIVAGVVSLWGLTVVTFLCRTLPSKIYNAVKKQVTTHLVVNSCDEVYLELLEWVSANKMHSWVRNLNFNNAKQAWVGDDWRAVPMISIGYGTTMFMFRGRLFFMNRVKEQANATSKVKEVITLTLLGRSHKVFEQLFGKIKKEYKEDDRVKIYRWDTSDWRSLNSQRKRGIDTVITDAGVKESIVDHIETFVAEKDWFNDHGIPYRTGILLYGPPGTGKTSLIKAICSKYEKDLYLLNLQDMADKGLLEALSTVPEKCVVVIEDIDTLGLKNRSVNKELKADGSDSDKLDMNGLFSSMTLGGLLNAIDGPASAEGRILIATTNHVEKLDPALVRAGRFDLKREIGYLNDETLREYLTRFFPDIEYEGTIKDSVPTSTLQQLVFENRKDPTNILKEVLQ